MKQLEDYGIHYYRVYQVEFTVIYLNQNNWINILKSEVHGTGEVITERK